MDGSLGKLRPLGDSLSSAWFKGGEPPRRNPTQRTAGVSLVGSSGSGCLGPLRLLGREEAPAEPAKQPLPEAGAVGPQLPALQEAAQVVRQVACRGVTVGWVLLQALQADALQRAGDAGLQPAGRFRLVPLDLNEQRLGTERGRAPDPSG